MECSLCSKSFPTQVLLETHNRNKHSKKEQVDTQKPKVESSTPITITGKFKGGFEQYQQDLEDKIYAFLGELGEKNATNAEDGENVII